MRRPGPHETRTERRRGMRHLPSGACSPATLWRPVAASSHRRRAETHHRSGGPYSVGRQFE